MTTARQKIKRINSPITVLIVDDNLAVQSALSELLSTEEMECELADIVSEAIRQLEAIGERLDLVITDYQLPDGVGTEIIWAVKGMKLDCKVIGMSGNGDNKAPFLAAGAVGFLEKPVGEKEVVSMVKKILN